MSTKTNQFNDIDHLKRTQEALLDGMTIMHKALSDIASCEVAFIESKEMRDIAKSALKDLNEITFGIKGDTQNA
jgi:hypothetical protein